MTAHEFNRPPRPREFDWWGAPDEELPPVDDDELMIFVADLLADGPITPMQAATAVLGDALRRAAALPVNDPRKRALRLERRARSRRVMDKAFLRAGAKAGWWSWKGGRLRLPE